MTRTDSHEYPGLGNLRSNPSNDDQDNTNGYGSHNVLQTNRRPSYELYGGGITRAMEVSERENGIAESSDPNRSIPALSSQVHVPAQPFSFLNHHYPYFVSPPLSQTSLYPYSDRDFQLFRHSQSSPPASTHIQPVSLSSARSTVWWGELEPWMDEEYAKQVCGLMGWDPVNIKIPHPAPDPITGQQANNPGYCFLTFPSPAHAASVLAQVNNSGNGTPVIMPNSNKPFVLNWASSVQSSMPIMSTFPAIVPAAQPKHEKEYSIFVGDLAPETSNSDLVAVFRNPVLGLRNDREPKFIRPFLSCKSAKIMLDPVTGVSRGYGFVRFTDEADQQRALIEMHGLYCLSRPMRISPATAKYKPQPTLPLDLPQVQFPPPQPNGLDQTQPVTIAVPLSKGTQATSVSAPIAAAPSSASCASSNSGSNVSASGSSSASLGTSSSINSLTATSASSTSVSSNESLSDDKLNLSNNAFVQLAQQYANPSANSDMTTGPGADITAPRYTISEESWKHHAQARAILGNLIGPNGEQLTSTDPYNTTVFVGGLSPLISEETLRTFFAPFGDIHYVKVPVGKHCGFVQFVRKADAERAIEKMQGFPIGGSRIRLSWGRSQYKAAQAAAQAAQTAALQSQFAAQYSQAAVGNVLTQEQALQLLQRLSIQGHVDQSTSSAAVSGGSNTSPGGYLNGIKTVSVEEKLRPSFFSSFDGPLPFESHLSSFGRRASQFDIQPTGLTNFSPFSPDPNQYGPLEPRNREIESIPRTDTLPHPSKAFAPGFFPSPQDTSLTATGSVTGSKPSTSTRPSSAPRFPLLENISSAGQPNRAPGRPGVTISRPPSGQTSSPLNCDSQDIQDLNGTLASLDLDHSWKKTIDGHESARVSGTM